MGCAPKTLTITLVTATLVKGSSTSPKKTTRSATKAFKSNFPPPTGTASTTAPSLTPSTCSPIRGQEK